MLQAAAAMAPSLAELNYSTMIPSPSASPPTTLGSGSISTFAHFGPKLGLDNEPGLSPIHHHHHHHHHHHKSHDDDAEDDNHFPEQEIDIDSNEGAVQLEFPSASASLNQMMAMNPNNNSREITKTNRNGKRKRARSGKTSEEAENQRMAHIAVERNRRKQMNEHLRVLRSLMPSSYVQRGDQASIVGGAIEFVRELEQLLQCLESQKRRRIYGEDVALLNDDRIIDGGDQAANMDRLMMNTAPNSGLAGLHEEAAESKSAIADVEVKLVGFDAFIKILTRRRPGQLIKAVSALQDLEFSILHTNVTTIEQTALYSFNVKIGGETRFRADDVASSVQQIFTFIHANSAI